MGLKDKSGVSKAVVPVQVDEKGKIRYDALLRQGTKKDKIIHSTYDSLAAVDVTKDEESRQVWRAALVIVLDLRMLYQMPDEEAVAETTEKTRLALERIVTGKLQNIRTTHVDQVNRDATYVRYTPGQLDQSQNSGADQRIIRMVNVQVS